ncbi:MAG: DUF420 domain-containing protein [Phycisphaeraceae bacterium]|nr:DUF420 domain-containing protein [Phycisphaeraceae bacterium]
MDLSFIPHFNVGLNTLAILCLVLGFVAIRRRNITLHRNLMISAFAVSALFLVLYVVHKAWRATQDGDIHTTYNGQGALQIAYYLILITHLVLAMAVPVLAIMLIWLGLKDRREKHRRIARWGFPIWLYVSVTGVIVYLMLYPFNPPPA